MQALQGRGLIVSALVARGDPVAQILDAAQRSDTDMIVLSTHRKTGLEAFWSKSVAPRVAQATRKPLIACAARMSAGRVATESRLASPHLTAI